MPDTEEILIVDDKEDAPAPEQRWRRQHLDERRAGLPGGRHVLRFSHKPATKALYATLDHRLVA